MFFFYFRWVIGCQVIRETKFQGLLVAVGGDSRQELLSKIYLD